MSNDALSNETGDAAKQNSERHRKRSAKAPASGRPLIYRNLLRYIGRDATWNSDANLQSCPGAEP